MRRGSVIHDGYEEMFTKFDSDEAKVVLELDDEEGLEMLFKDAIMAELTEADEKTESIVDGLASLCTDRFIGEVEDNTEDRFKPIASELRFHSLLTFEFGGEEYNVHLTGLIDHIFHGDEGGIIIGELKTGPFKKAQYIRPEMAFYALGLENLIPGIPLMANAGYGSGTAHVVELPSLKIEGWGWEYPASRHRGYEKYGKRSVTACRKRIEKMLRAHINYDFPGNTNRCVWCPFTRNCPIIHPSNYLGETL
jgi:hypothetical protein